MPRHPRHGTGGRIFHVYNRAIENLVLFTEAKDYDALLRILKEAAECIGMRILAFVVMPNHWHLILWPADDTSLSRFMHRFSSNHARLWRSFRVTTGRGAVYQGRFKDVPIQCDGHLLRVLRYVERNPLRARLVARAEDWPWSSATLRHGGDLPTLTAWPIPRPADWREILNVPEPRRELKAVRDAIRQGIPFGDEAWRQETEQALGWSNELRRRPGRPSPGAAGGSSTSAPATPLALSLPFRW